MFSKIRVLRDSRAAVGEKGSPGFGDLDLRGFPAKACDCKFMDMVVVVVVGEVLCCEKGLVRDGD